MLAMHIMNAALNIRSISNVICNYKDTLIQFAFINKFYCKLYFIKYLISSFITQELANL